MLLRGSRGRHGKCHAHCQEQGEQMCGFWLTHSVFFRTLTQSKTQTKNQYSPCSRPVLPLQKYISVVLREHILETTPENSRQALTVIPIGPTGTRCKPIVQANPTQTSPQLRTSSQVMLGCSKLINKTKWHDTRLARDSQAPSKYVHGMLSYMANMGCPPALCTSGSSASRPGQSWASTTCWSTNNQCTQRILGI